MSSSSFSAPHRAPAAAAPGSSHDQLDDLYERCRRSISLIRETPLPADVHDRMLRCWTYTADRVRSMLADRRYGRQTGEELAVLQNTLLPPLINYQVSLGAYTYDRVAPEAHFCARWRDIWAGYRD